MAATEFSWWNIVPTVVGAGISIITTVIMFGVSERNERKKRKADSILKLEAFAFSAQTKLSSILAWYRAVSRSLEVASSEELNSIVAPQSQVTEFSSDELFVAMKSGDVSLVGKLAAAHGNYMTAFELLHRFETKIVSIQSFADASALDRSSSDDSAKFIIHGFHSGALRQEAIRFRNELNESTKQGITEIREVAEMLYTAANSIPDVKLSVRIS
jgi:hypothetical protein